MTHGIFVELYHKLISFSVRVGRYTNFLWDGKGDKIKRHIMINDYENGGLRIKKLSSTYFGLVIYPTFFGKNLNNG